MISQNGTMKRGRSTSKCADSPIDLRAETPERSWAGIPVVYLGRIADIGHRCVVIGEACGECAYGRIILNCGTLRCNTCQHTLGDLQKFEDDGFSARRAVELLRDAPEATPFRS